jgi:hypothetical protein
MTILAVGDSFTFGLELSDLPSNAMDLFGNYLDDTNQNPRPAEPSKLAWPSLLANTLGHDVVNISTPGASNDWIFKKTVEHVLKNRYDFVICAWTTIDRYNFSYQQQELQLSASNRSVTDWFPWFKDFVTDHHDFKISYDTWICRIVTLEAFLKQHQQPYLFANAMSPHMFYDSGDLCSSFGNDVNLFFDQSRYIDWWSGFDKWCQQYPTGKYGHFLEDGHRHVASRVHKFIEMNNLWNFR